MEVEVIPVQDGLQAFIKGSFLKLSRNFHAFSITGIIEELYLVFLLNAFKERGERNIVEIPGDQDILATGIQSHCTEEDAAEQVSAAQFEKVY